ncbi:helix-turn-helix domain-containing protein [Kibdelosporangium phytohabitans]|nr:helix-turn-helix transcriptional regulator [Kibdelosporangium phytohabitans]
MIRTARKRLGYTQEQLGTMIGCTQSKIGKLEIGFRAISLNDVEPLIVALELSDDDAQSFRHLARVAANMRNDESTGTWPRWFTKYRDLESTATRIRSWTGERLPGILQSELYMLAMFGAPGKDPDVSDVIRGRLERRRVLDRADPPECEYVFSPGFLSHLCGSYRPGVALDQIEHLMRIAEYPSVSVLILPYTSGLPCNPGDFTIFTVPGTPRLPPHDEAWTENEHTGKAIPKEEDVRTYLVRWNEIRNACLDGNESLTLLDKHREEVRHQP